MRKISDIICGNHPPDWADNPKLMSTKDARRLTELTNKQNAEHKMKLSRREAAELHAIREHIRKQGENWTQTGIGKIIYYPHPMHKDLVVKHNLTTGDRETEGK